MSVEGATIRRQQRAAHKAMVADVERRLEALAAIYQRAADDIQARITALAGASDRVALSNLREVRAYLDRRIEDVARARDELLTAGMHRGADLAAQAWSTATVLSPRLPGIADEAVQFAREFVYSDGLALSDRLWRLDRGARELLANTVESAIIQGEDASHAVLDFLTRGEAVPEDLLRRASMANPERLRAAAAEALMTGENNAYRQAVRVVRTEIIRAHGHAHRAAMNLHPDVVGVKFTLSPRHPRPDECDMHASVNRYGMGPGIYPIDRSPWPAHPETYSYEQPVFSDEIEEDAADGKQDRLAWLQDQDEETQVSVLGGLRKQRAFTRGWLTERSIRTPWRALRPRLERQGYPVDDIDPTP